MDSPDHTHAGPPGPGWQLLAELELPARASVEASIRVWITEILHPLGLHEDFQRRLLASAQDAADRAFQPDAAKKFDHIHITIHIPHNHDAQTGTWGFFRVEKIESFDGETAASAHSIEFYLYLEGQDVLP